MLLSVIGFLRRNFAVVLFAVLVAFFYPQLNEKAKELLGKSKFSEKSLEKIIARKEEPKYKEVHKNPSRDENIDRNIKLFSAEELAQYDGIEKDRIYLSILGKIYDVTKGSKHYAKGGPYNFFVGRDASAAFVTGEFQKFDESSGDVLKLTPTQVLSFDEWSGFYDKEYDFIGHLTGRFYDDSGAKTEYHLQMDIIKEEAARAKANKEKIKDEFPECNVEWTKDTGTKVWCTTSSGGRERDWIGVPRKYFAPGEKTWRCACVHKDKLQSEKLKTYENCSDNSDTCYYQLEN